MKKSEQQSQGFNRLLQTAKKYPFAVICLATVVIFLWDYALLMRWQLQTRDALNTEMNLRKSALKSFDHFAQTKEAKEKEIEQLKQQVESFDQRLWQKQDLPLLLKDLDQLATEQGIVVEQMKLDTASEKELLRREQKRYFKIPIELSARGGFTNLINWLAEMEKRFGLFSVDELSIRADSVDPLHHSVYLLLQVMVKDVPEAGSP